MIGIFVCCCVVIAPPLLHVYNYSLPHVVSILSQFAVSPIKINYYILSVCYKSPPVFLSLPIIIGLVLYYLFVIKAPL